VVNEIRALFASCRRLRLEPVHLVRCPDAETAVRVLVAGRSSRAASATCSPDCGCNAAIGCICSVSLPVSPRRLSKVASGALGPETAVARDVALELW
jgi:hypothetical protein